MELLTTKTWALRSAKMQDKEKIFRWLTDSNLTRDMFGPSNFHYVPVPNRE